MQRSSIQQLSILAFSPLFFSLSFPTDNLGRGIFLNNVFNKANLACMLCVASVYTQTIFYHKWKDVLQKKSRETMRFTLKDARLFRSRRGVAVPISFLILFASTSLIVSVTYYFAVSKINSRNVMVNVSAAKSNMEFLSNGIQATVWTTGASEHFYFSDCGGEFKTEPTANLLLLNITDNQSFYDVFFSSSVGRVLYDLPQCDFQTETLYIKGDCRSIVNKSSSTITQLCIFQGSDSPEIKICYRPMATSSSNGLGGGKPLNIVCVYVVNLNQSQSLLLSGNFDLMIICTNVTSVLKEYDFASPISSLTVKATLAENETSVTVPISSNAQGATVQLETIICEIRLQRVSD